jgi:hypothetical protein
MFGGQPTEAGFTGQDVENSNVGGACLRKTEAELPVGALAKFRFVDPADDYRFACL